MISRRRLLAGMASLTAAPLAAAPDALTIRIDDLAAGVPISPFIYGSNETGNMDGNGQSVDYDLKARPSIRRIGGNLLTGYNWLNNAAHAGKDYQHANGAFLLDALALPRGDWDKPAAVIEKFLANSRIVGAPSLVTLPLAGYVAADLDGPVSEKEAAPSPRFLAVDWSAPDKALKGAVNMPSLVARLVSRHGGAASGGVRGYYLDNEPGLWTNTHPRIVTQPPTIRSLIERSLQAAAAIKSIAPDAWVLGPTSWGAPEFVDFQKAPDWPEFSAQGSFLGAYLDAFRQESERVGKRLLDHLDIHWYAFNKRGDLFRTENPDLAQALLDAPRSLDEPGFCEESWVLDVLGCKKREGLYLPLLPALRETIAAKYPGTGLSIGEYNYGGAGLFQTSLAMADALGRFGRSGVDVATHWGSLAGSIGEAFRLYRMTNFANESFGGASLPVSGGRGYALSLFAARSARGALHLIALNKSAHEIRFDLTATSGRKFSVLDAMGFDELRPACAFLGDAPSGRFVLPPLSARRYTLAA